MWGVLVLRGAPAAGGRGLRCQEASDRSLHAAPSLGPVPTSCYPSQSLFASSQGALWAQGAFGLGLPSGALCAWASPGPAPGELFWGVLGRAQGPG